MTDPRSEPAGPPTAGGPAPWPEADRVMVCVSPSPWSGQLVRAAARWAGRLRTPWFAVHIDNGRADAASRARVAEHLMLAERLGARAVTIPGDEVTAELLAFARTNSVRLLLVGRTPRGAARSRQSPAEQLLRAARGIDVLVVDGEGPTPVAAPTAPRRWRGGGYLWATAAVALCTVASAFLAPYIGLGNADALYLLAVVAVAARHGRGPAVYASALGVLAFDFFIVPPAFGFVPEDAAYVVTFAVMLAVALTVSAFAAALREQAEVARERFARTATLYDLAADLGRAADVPAVAQVVGEHVRQVFGCAATVLAAHADGVLRPLDGRRELVLTEADLAAARAALASGAPAGHGCDGHGSLRTLHVPLRTAAATIGVLSLQPEPPDRFAHPAERLHLEAFANQTALALERAHLAAAEQRARLEADQERLRNTLLRSVSHDLRTPVAAIQGSASALLQSEALPAGTRRELLQSICESSDRLARRIHNLLEVTRLETGAVQLSLEWTPLDEVVGAVLTSLADAAAQRAIRVDVPATLPPLPLDGLLAQQVVTNLVENALRHAPGAEPIDIVARRNGPEVVLQIDDRGPGIPPGEAEQVFTKFHRVAGSGGAGGTGLGLAIARAIMELHSGRIWVEPRPGGGASFRAAFPCTSPALGDPAPAGQETAP